jgi:hypothetical protein
MDKETTMKLSKIKIPKASPYPVLQDSFIMKHKILALLLSLLIACFVASIFGLSVPKVGATPIQVDDVDALSFDSWCTDMGNRTGVPNTQTFAYGVSVNESFNMLGNWPAIYVDPDSPDPIRACDVSATIWNAVPSVTNWQNHASLDAVYTAGDTTDLTFTITIQQASTNQNLTVKGENIPMQFAGQFPPTSSNLTLRKIQQICNENGCVTQITVFAPSFNWSAQNMPYGFSWSPYITNPAALPPQSLPFSLSPFVAQLTEVNMYVEAGLVEPETPPQPEPLDPAEEINDWLKDDNMQGVVDDLNNLELPTLNSSELSGLSSVFQTVIVGLDNFTPKGYTCMPNAVGPANLINYHINYGNSDLVNVPEINIPLSLGNSALANDEKISIKFPCFREIVAKKLSRCGVSGVCDVDVLIIALNVPVIIMLLIFLYMDIMTLFSVKGKGVKGSS